jgi:catechol 2,3-dioxygenase-like lactoylglutathione lyase family enzyme
MHITKIKETCLYVEGLEKTKSFYTEVMGFPVISFVENRHVFFRAGASVLLCFLPESTRNEKELPPHFGSGQLHVAFEVPPDQYAKWKADLSAKGVKIEYEQFWFDDIYSIYFRDPDNHLLEIIPEGMWEPK